MDCQLPIRFDDHDEKFLTYEVSSKTRGFEQKKCFSFKLLSKFLLGNKVARYYRGRQGLGTLLPMSKGNAFHLCPASIEFARPFGTAGEIDSGRLLLLKISFKIHMLELFGAACQVALGIPQSLSSTTSLGYCSLASPGFCCLSISGLLLFSRKLC